MESEGFGVIICNSSNQLWSNPVGFSILIGKLGKLIRQPFQNPEIMNSPRARL